MVLSQRKLYVPKDPEGVQHFPGGRGSTGSAHDSNVISTVGIHQSSAKLTDNIAHTPFRSGADCWTHIIRMTKKWLHWTCTIMTLSGLYGAYLIINFGHTVNHFSYAPLFKGPHFFHKNAGIEYSLW